MTERKGWIEEWGDSLDIVYVITPHGEVIPVKIQTFASDEADGLISQGNAFYDRESAELAARKRAAIVKWERFTNKNPVQAYKWTDMAIAEMGADMELLR